MYHGNYNKQLISPNKTHGKMENILLALPVHIVEVVATGGPCSYEQTQCSRKSGLTQVQL